MGKKGVSFYYYERHHQLLSTTTVTNNKNYLRFCERKARRGRTRAISIIISIIGIIINPFVVYEEVSFAARRRASSRGPTAAAAAAARFVRRRRRRPSGSHLSRAAKMTTTTTTTSEEEETPVTFVTGNAKKLEEVKHILASSSSVSSSCPSTVRIVSRALDLPELQGDPKDIATEKCLLASKEIRAPTLVEDTSLCFNALKGLPGPYVKWFLEKTGLDGLNNMLAAYEDKTAYAQCIFAYCDGKSEDVELFVGRTNGRIVKARGKTEFGWDAVFEPDEQRDEKNRKTYGEMEKEEKNTISHRFRALEKLRKAKFQ